MKLVVGLGNFGEKYKHTRHNTGFLVLDELVNEILKLKISNFINTVGDNFHSEKKFHAEIFRMSDVIFAKPTTLMNNSGMAVLSLCSYFKIQSSDLFIIHDDLDIKLGEYKIQLGVGPKIHNGLLSIYEKLGKKDFWHIRIGIDNRTNEDDLKISGQEYVLGEFEKEERAIVVKVIEKSVRELVGKIMG